MRSPTAGLIAMLLALPLAAVTGASVARAEPLTREQCLGCHATPDITRDTGGSVHVDRAAFQASAHGGLECVSCHTGVTSLIHPERLPRVRCVSCHAEAIEALRKGIHARVGLGQDACTTCHGDAHTVRATAGSDGKACVPCHAEVANQYSASVHGVMRAHGDREASTCRDCHGPTHAVLSHRDPRSSTSRDSVAATCARCHSDREMMTRRKITIPAAVALYRNSVHGRSRNPDAPTCNDCHSSHQLKRASDPGSAIYKTHIPQTCGRCHAREAADYEASVHGTALARGVMPSPVCTDCHGEHRIRGPSEPGSPVAPAGVTATCAHCHEAVGIRETYGLPAGRLTSYQDSFHGLAARGGSPAVANCASCHGYHRILPSSDPASAIHPSNLPSTCGKCHPGAGERFARGAVHVVMVRPDRPVLRVVRIVYLWLIAITIGGMVLHGLLDFGHKAGRRLRAQLAGAAHAAAAAGSAATHAVTEGGRWFLRMTVSERLQHGLLAVSFFTLVFTGFALKFPETWAFAWLARLEGGYAWRSLIHRGAAVVMIATSLWHVGYLFGARGRRLVRDLLPRPADAVQAFQNVAYLIGRRPAPPAFERFGYIEKVEYWALIWGTVVMSVTGVLLWFTNLSLRWLDKWVLDLATLVHYYEAWLAFLAIVVWHLYQNIANPDVYPMNWTWLHGRISEEQLRHEHAAEWARRVAGEPTPAAAEPPAPGTSATPGATPSGSEPSAPDDPV